ncbi:RNA 2'-phosphotransferase [Stackebrandtia soli]|uniref:RNA 2'-phosphotransferase n=1 Tax=Stackebrandtia soli TaxID=1892856 RepID=UPI0039EA0985
MNEQELVKLSKRLSRVLRHRPETIGITLDSQGWVDVPDLLKALSRTGTRVTPEQLAEVVERNDKKRFALEDGRIRARQGHSLDVDLGLPETEPPPVLYHGTVRRHLDSIRAHGLLRGNRHHVHLSSDTATARTVGSRRGLPVVLTVHAGRMAADGAAFHVTDNGVWLTEYVPVAYLADATGTPLPPV